MPLIIRVLNSQLQTKNTDQCDSHGSCEECIPVIFYPKIKSIIFHITAENLNLIIQINFSDENKGYNLNYTTLFLCFVLG